MALFPLSLQSGDADDSKMKWNGASKFPCIQSDRIRIFSPPHSALGPFYVPLNWDLRPQGAGHSPKQCTASIVTSIPSFPATKRCFHCPGSPPQASRALWGMGDCSHQSLPPRTVVLFPLYLTTQSLIPIWRIGALSRQAEVEMSIFSRFCGYILNILINLSPR